MIVSLVSEATKEEIRCPYMFTIQITGDKLKATSTLFNKLEMGDFKTWSSRAFKSIPMGEEIILMSRAVVETKPRRKVKSTQ